MRVEHVRDECADKGINPVAVESAIKFAAQLSPFVTTSDVVKLAKLLSDTFEKGYGIGLADQQGDKGQ